MKCIAWCNVSVLRAFYHYGVKVGKYPWTFMLGCVIVCGILAAGMTKMDPENDIENLYTPRDSQERKNRDIYERYFPHTREIEEDFDDYGSSHPLPEAMIIFKTPPDVNILKGKMLAHIKTFLELVKGIEVTVYNPYINTSLTFNYTGMCLRRRGECISSHFIVLEDIFRTRLIAGDITYPISEFYPYEDLSGMIGNPTLGQAVPPHNNRVLLGARSLSLKLGIMIKGFRGQLEWLKKFVGVMKKIVPEFKETVPNLDIAYSTTGAIDSELEENTRGDIIFFAMTFLLMITYATMVSSGGDMVSTRAFLSFGGVLANSLGIAATVGLVSMLGIKYVNMVGVMPFLLLGVGVDDMFLLMSSWSETSNLKGLTVPQRIGKVFKKAGIGITITSLTNFMSLTIGATSTFLSVRNFCIYTGTGVLLCYLTNITFFGGCLAIHGRRISENRHTLTCMKVKTGDQASADGHGILYRLFCSGNKPKRPMHDQSFCEMWPSFFMPRFALWWPVRISAFIIFPINLCVAIWGCTQIKEGLNLKDLLLEGSYAYKYHNLEWDDFGGRFSVTFVTTKANYTDPNTLEEMTKVMQRAKDDKDISSQMEICWLTLYAKSKYYNISSETAFNNGLDKFLLEHPRFRKDVHTPISENLATRCHVHTNKLTKMQEEALVMVRMRELVKKSPIVDFAFNKSFIFFDQFILIFSTTMQTVGLTIAVMCVVTSVFLPHPLIVLIVMSQVMMVMTCIFGYMALCKLSLSSITMTHLIMSVGLSVDFCAHVCTAYMVSEKRTKYARAEDAIIHASGPILNGGTSSMVGILGLLLSKTFIFQSFFIIMSLVIGFGVAHAVFFVPAVLSVIGPKNYVNHVYDYDEDASNRRTNVDSNTPNGPQLTSKSEQNIGDEQEEQPPDVNVLRKESTEL